ncbi:MAG: FAD-dependent oxidoreductase [Ilumatobacter sp.]|nr:FAD-dependent oxidoreductase [Ilumatobacter sp.]MCB0983978.1 FAD-dependent oxidoreductase [Ilumatobacter sp.]
MSGVGIVEAATLTADVPGWDHEVDVVVVGLGAAGVSAALEAHRGGAQVLVLERASGGGGASAASEGIFYLGGGTTLQRDLGVDDTPDNMYAFMRAVTSTPDDGTLRLFCDEAAEHFDWLEAQGVHFERALFTGKAVAVRTGAGLLTTGNEKVWPFREAAAPAPRGHQAEGSEQERGGAPAMRALLATFEREGVPALYDTGVVGLVRDPGGRVVGVHGRRHGADVWVRARAGVVLATGSFNLNAEMTKANFPTFATYGQPLGIDTNDGAGVQLGQSVGGATRGMDGVIATASIYPPAELIKGIVVNNRGERFVPEDAYHGRLAHFVERQPDHQAFLIVDEEIFAYPEKGSHRMVDGYETVAEMEAGLGVPAGSLAATLDGYNRDVADGEDRRFHKHHDWLKPLHPPFVVFDISVTSSDYHYIALGGLAIDVDGRAQKADGTIIDGLYAVGACAAHFPQNGHEYASGMSLGPGSWWGRRAGRHAAQRAG